MSEQELSASMQDAVAAIYDQLATDQAKPETPEAEPARDESGRFAAKEPEAKEPEAPPAEEADDYDEAVGLDRETWKQTPAQARERAKALAAEKRAAEERAKAYDPIDRVLAPRRDALRASFGDEARAMEQLFHLSDWAGRDFPGFVRHLADQRGIDLRALVPAEQPGQPAQPDADAIISQRVDRILQEREAQRALQDFERNDAFEFRNDADIRRVMGGLLASGAATDLPTAYAMAVKAHPQISAKLAERESAERAKRDREEAARSADRKAAATAVSTRGAPGVASAPASKPQPANAYEAAALAFEEAAARV